MYEETKEAVKDSPLQDKFLEFFRHSCIKNIERLAQNYPDKRSLIVDFKELEHFDYELADELLSNPDECLEAANEAISDIDIPSLDQKKFRPQCRCG